MFNASKGTATELNGKKCRIGVVQARFNDDITNALWSACRDELLRFGVTEKNITHVTVPGALEVASALQGMAESSDFDALIALGCIIRGETYHFELVANESGAGVTRVALDYQIPIANAKDGVVVSEIYGNYMGFVDFDGKRYWDLREMTNYEPVPIP